MSVDYNVFLRAKPDLAAFEEEYELEKDGDDYIFGGFRLWVHEYAASDDDPLADHPWQSQITWVLAANGRHHDSTYDDFVSFLEAVADRYNGGVWCDHGDDEVEWHGWDRDGLDKRA